MFYAFRVYAVSKLKVYPIVMLPLAIGRIGLVIAFSVMSHRMRSLDVFNKHYLWLSVLPMALIVLIDVCNTTFMCLFLYKSRGYIRRLAELNVNQEFRTNTVLDTLILWTIGKQSFSSTTWNLDLISFVRDGYGN